MRKVLIRTLNKSLCRWNLLLACLLSGVGTVYAQDPQFTQFYAAPLYLNPAFTGSTGQGRASMNFRHQWPGLEANFVTYMASYDQFFEGMNSGFGFMVKSDQQGPNVGTPLRSTDASLLYSFMAQLSDDIALQMGLQTGYGTRNLNFQNFLFGDQLTNRGPTGMPTAEFFPTTSIGYWDISSGFLLFNEFSFVGMSFHHLNRPNLSFFADFGGLDRLPMKVTIHAGATIPTRTLSGAKGGRKDFSDRTIMPMLLYMSQGKSDQFSAGVYYRHNPFLVSIWYRGLPVKRYDQTVINQDALALMIGLQHKRWNFGYSYDITVSRLRRESAGSHEISLSYLFPVNENKKNPKRNFKFRQRVKCPNPWESN